jgi:hypothetical protein
MLRCAADVCAREIAAGSVRAVHGSYADSLGTELFGSTFDAIVANFAVLNLVENLAELFRALDRLVAPPGAIIVSILNVLHWRDLRYAWWWSNLARLTACGGYTIKAQSAPEVHRFTLARLQRAAAPTFRICRLAGCSGGARLEGGLRLATAKYLFVTLKR